jgi:hypothetical protein
VPAKGLSVPRTGPRRAEVTKQELALS